MSNEKEMYYLTQSEVDMLLRKRDMYRRVSRIVYLTKNAVMHVGSRVRDYWL
jgi:hypothetical protein